MSIVIAKLTLNGITQYLVRGSSDHFYSTHEEALAKAVEYAHTLAVSLRRPIGLEDRVTE